MVSYEKNKMKSLAIIPARGGSKRIPYKNIRSFLGKPIILYSIESAICSEVFDEIMVSTDSNEIAELARDNCANVPFLRSAKNSTDEATTSDVISEVIHYYSTIGIFFDIVFCIYPTAPLINPKHLQDAYALIASNPAIDSVIPVVPFSYPPQRGLIIDNGLLRMQNPKYKSSRSQDIEPVYHDAGQFYAFKSNTFLETHDLWSGNIYPLVLSELEVQDIDNMSDWTLAELKYNILRQAPSIE